MTHIKFEDVLGKDISVFEETIGADFENKLYGNNSYYLKNHLNTKEFFGMSYSMISVNINEKAIVQSITIHFQELIDHEFYNSFNNAYGEPKHIQVIENRKLESETYLRDDNGNVTQHLKKNTFDLREGAFRENPLFIIWEKEKFLIKAFLRKKNRFNLSEIAYITGINTNHNKI